MSQYNAQYWNAAYVVAGKPVLYNGFVAYFRDLAAAVKAPDYPRTVTDGAETAYFFPRASSTRDSDDPTTDPVVSLLDRVSCTGSTRVGTPTDHWTVVRLAMWGFTRAEVARALRRLADEGCQVDVALNQGVPDREVSAEVKTLLLGHRRIHVVNAWSSGMLMHAKYLLVEGTYDGATDTKVAWLGAHNFTVNALRHNDESLLEVRSAAAHDALRGQFGEVEAPSRGVVF